MCLAVYLAASSPLPLIPFHNDAPAFNVTDLNEREGVVRGKFSHPFVACAGSHSHCGCGFTDSRSRGETHDEAVAKRRESLARLANYVRDHGVRAVFACWDGAQGEPIQSERRIVVEDLLASDFVLEEGQLLTFGVDADPG